VSGSQEKWIESSANTEQQGSKMKTTVDELTNQEKALLRQYQTLSTSLPSLTNRLAVEIVPASVFGLMWYFSGNVAPLLLLILIMVFYNIQRVLRQHKIYKTLNSISQKAIGYVHEEKNPLSN